MKASLLFYRVLAYVVGVGLIILVLVGVPLKYLADSRQEIKNQIMAEIDAAVENK